MNDANLIDMSILAVMSPLSLLSNEDFCVSIARGDIYCAATPPEGDCVKKHPASYTHKSRGNGGIVLSCSN